MTVSQNVNPVAHRYNQLLARGPDDPNPFETFDELFDLNSQIDDLLHKNKAILYDDLAKRLAWLNPFENPERRRAVIAAIRDTVIVDPGMPYDENIIDWDAEDDPIYRYEVYTEDEKLAVAERWARGQIPRLLILEGAIVFDKYGQQCEVKHGWIKDSRGTFLSAHMPDGVDYFSGERDCTDVREAFNTPPIDGRGHDRILAYAAAVAREVYKTVDAKKERAEAKSRDKIVVRDVADYAERKVNWLWKGRCHANKVGLLAGDGGLGKSAILLDMAYRVSVGAAWPDGAGWAPKGTVLIVNQEDDVGDVFKPRLRELGADMRKIKIIEGVLRDGQEGDFSLQYDIGRLKDLLHEYPDTKLIIIDPLSSAFGDGVNMWKESEVRAVLKPLKPLAEEFGVTIVGNMHLTKGSNRTASNANLALLNSVGLSSFARFIMQVEADDENPDTRRVFGSTKLSVGKPGRPMAYGFKDRDDVDWPDLEWLGFTDKRIADLRGRSGRGGRHRTERDDAENFLKEILASGPKLSRDVMLAGLAEKFSERTLERARRGLGVVGGRFVEGDDRWYVALPTWAAAKQTADNDDGIEDEDW